MRAYKCLRFKDRISHYIVHRELPAYESTKASKYCLFLSPRFEVLMVHVNSLYIALNIRVSLEMSDNFLMDFDHSELLLFK